MREVLSPKRLKNLQDLARCLEVDFRDIVHLHHALTHTSYAHESKSGLVIHNERLEFLGDAVLELASSTYLFQHFPRMPEGDMTKARASVVCEAALAKAAKALDLGAYLLLGHGEAVAGGAKRPSILADAFEAVIGAIYMDQGWKIAEEYVLAKLHSELVLIDSGNNLQDYKTILQEKVQQHTGHKIVYQMVSADGPDHAKIFNFVVLINDKICGHGTGSSKKDAEQQAAHEALHLLNK